MEIRKKDILLATAGVFLFLIIYSSLKRDEIELNENLVEFKGKSKRFDSNNLPQNLKPPIKVKDNLI